MIRPPRNIADTWGELIILTLGLLLFLPFALIVLIFVLPFLALEATWHWARREPKPTIPELTVKTNEDRDSKIIAEELAVEAKRLISAVNIDHDVAGECYALTSSKLGKRTVRFTYDHGSAGIDIEDLNCYEWDNVSAVSMNLFFWVVIGVLRNGVTKTRSRIGRTNFWVKCDELGIWAVVQRKGSSYDSINFYKEPPARIMAKLKTNG